MGKPCGACCKNLLPGDSAVDCTRCKGRYHRKCLNISQKDLTKSVDKWFCPLCNAQEPRGDNSNTPVRTLSLTNEDFTNVNIATRRVKLTPTEPYRDQGDSLDSLLQEMQLLRKDMSEIKGKLQSISNGINNCNSRLDTFENRIIQTEARSTRYQVLNTL